MTEEKKITLQEVYDMHYDYYIPLKWQPLIEYRVYTDKTRTHIFEVTIHEGLKLEGEEEEFKEKNPQIRVEIRKEEKSTLVSFYNIQLLP